MSSILSRCNFPGSRAFGAISTYNMHRLAKLSSAFPSIALLGLVAKPQFCFCQGRGGPALPQVIFHRTIYQKLVLHSPWYKDRPICSLLSWFASLESRISITRVKEESSWMTDWHVRRNFSSPWRVQVSSVLIVDVDYLWRLQVSSWLLMLITYGGCWYRQRWSVTVD